MTDMEIEAFLAIVHAGSFSKASNELYISQSSLSRRIMSLEDELGYQLFIRKKGVRAVELTQAGRAFIESAAKWKTLWGEMKDIGALNSQKILNISVINSVNAYIMPGFFNYFMQENPQIYLTVRSVPALDTFRYVENGIVDLALFSDDSHIPNANMLPAYQEPLLLLCNKKCGLPKEVSPQMFDVSKHIYMPWNRDYDSWYNRVFSSSQRPRVWMNSIQHMEEILLSNDYWTILPASAAYKIGRNPELSIHTIQNGPPDRIIYYLLGPYQKREATILFLKCFDVHLKTHHEKSVTSLIDIHTL